MKLLQFVEHKQKTEKMFLGIAKKAIIMIILFFVKVTSFGVPSKLRFKCDRTVCKVCDTDTLFPALLLSLSLFILLLLAAI